MALFGKIFEKKECSICGGEIGLLGNRKLEDGNCCKNCVQKLSPWFDDRRHSTVDQIKQQLAYREENRAALATFRPTVSFGERYTLRVELVNGVPTRFVIERNNSYMEENADLISFRDVTSFNIDVHESEEELMRRNSQGEEVSYVPPRYQYSYDFYAEIHINHPYFGEISFQLNRNSVDLETIGRSSGFGSMRSTFDPTLYPEYRQQRGQYEELEELFRAGMQGMPVSGFAQTVQAYAQPYGQPAAQPYAQPYGQPAAQPYAQPYGQPAAQSYGQSYGQPTPQPEYQSAPAAAGPKFCPNCGTPSDGGKFCQSCGTRL